MNLYVVRNAQGLFYAGMDVDPSPDLERAVKFGAPEDVPVALTDFEIVLLDAGGNARPMAKPSSVASTKSMVA